MAKQPKQKQPEVVVEEPIAVEEPKIVEEAITVEEDKEHVELVQEALAEEELTPNVELPVISEPVLKTERVTPQGEDAFLNSYFLRRL